ncbi:hypothetical protein [Arthrobacter sp. ZGTC131]|uniref:hypothetical protein n=1 Tax=Arthrobacter sp. ZGTC131 TaxID=2058898 RepID=UPI000CE3B8A0|nr:hypothetical protein [Arthrobacter sp. ZGTC131]
MNNLFFWIIILSLLIPVGMRMYRRSVQRRDQGQGFSGQFDGRFGGPNPGRRDNGPADGYTQQDYLSGGFGLPPASGRQELPPLDQPYGYPPYPGAPGAGGNPSGHQGPVPYEDSPEYRANPPHPQQPQQPGPPPGGVAPSTPPPPSAPQGFRARKLAELDQQYSNGEISMEEYMTRRNDITNG